MVGLLPQFAGFECGSNLPSQFHGGGQWIECVQIITSHSLVRALSPYLRVSRTFFRQCIQAS